MTISVIIPTFNEADHIASLVTFIRRLARKEVIQILVVDSGSDDATCTKAEKAGATVITTLRKSRASQMNLGAQHARGDILYFVHADVKLIPSVVDDILESLDEGFDSGCYRYVFDSDRLLLKFNCYFNRFSGIMCRGGDQTLFIKKSVFFSLGGFDEHFTIMEDYDFLIRLRKRYSFRIIPKNIIVSARKYETNSWVRVQIANLSVFVMFFLRRSPGEMKRIYKNLLTYRLL